MVFLVEISCLIGKLPITKSDCRETNLCQGHSKPVVDPIIKSMANTDHEDHQHAHPSPADHAQRAHEHSDHIQEHHHSGTVEHEEKPVLDATQQHTSCEAHADHEPEEKGTDLVGAIDGGIASLESCCIDDSMRFFSTPTYFQSNDAIAPIQIPLLVFCEHPSVIWNLLDEKAASFKPPENETLPTFSRCERFQVLLI